MSSFNGVIQEIPLIAVDNFEKSGMKFYFLSHCHSDHLKGIEKLSSDSPLYATPLSAFIIRRKYPQLEVRELEIGKGKNLDVTDLNGGTTINFLVTSLSAGHCIGACMLLFQIEGMDILYTGDFRISVNDAKRMRPLQEIVDYGNLVLYFDSTFMSPTYQKFPKLDQSIKKITEVVDVHLKASSSHKVYIKTSARYGYERLFIEISQKLRQKIYCFEEEVFEQYSQISEISKHVENNILNARIFVKPKHLSQREPEVERNVLHINLSAMHWSHWNERDEIVQKIRNDYYRICYATHNSFDEIQDFITYLKPKKVYLNVIPTVIKDRLDMVRRLREIQSNYMILSDNEDEEKPNFSRKISFKRTNDSLKLSDSQRSK